MIDKEKLEVANNRLDAKFAADNKDFVVWWRKHPHYDPDEDGKWAVKARVAYKVLRYRQEFLEAKEVGLST